MQNQYSLLYREDEREMYPVLKVYISPDAINRELSFDSFRQMFGTGSIVWSPLARGLLSRPYEENSERSNTDRKA